MVLSEEQAERMIRQRVLTPNERFQAVLMATMNDDKAELCTPDQPALRKFFEMNAALFRQLAGDAS